ncbi:MAG: hypothetical protein KVP17_004558 [Porospora cf. gigantea B]|nr:MAG: hypothetical protein KVP17_004558 [Porospora cf. gigantea B]
MAKHVSNPSPVLHPFERAREYQRALIGTKMDRMFAKPLHAVLEGHTDAILCVRRCRTRVSECFTVGADGDLRQWNLGNKTCVRAINAHEGFARSVCLTEDDQFAFTVGDDKKIKQWLIPESLAPEDMTTEELDDRGHHVDLKATHVDDVLARSISPTATYLSTDAVHTVDHHLTEPLLLSAGDSVQIWNTSRGAPVHKWTWGYSSFTACRFNPAETSLLAAGTGDNAFVLYDLREASPLKKVVLNNKVNALAWNPYNPLCLTVANEDSNLYTYDARRLDDPLHIHRDMTNAVTDIDFSPTGREFAASSFDCTVRIWKSNFTRSREIYHTKRMQYANSCQFTSDSRFVLSASSDFCLRIWKANASEKLGPKTLQEKQAISYRRALSTKYKDLPEIRKIRNKRTAPVWVKNAKTSRDNKLESVQRKEHNFTVATGTILKSQKQRVTRRVDD